MVTQQHVYEMSCLVVKLLTNQNAVLRSDVMFCSETLLENAKDGNIDLNEIR